MLQDAHVSKNKTHYKPLSDGTNKNQGAGCFFLFGLFFALFGSVFVYIFLIAPAWKMTAASNWVEVPCTIISSSLGVNHDSEGDTYRVEVRFAYHYDPHALESDSNAPRYESSMYDFSGGTFSSGRGSKNAIVQTLQPGSKHTCWVNPNKPDEAVLKHGLPDDWWFASFTLIFPLVGIGVMWLGLHMRRTERLRKAGLLPLSGTSTTRATTREPSSAALAGNGPIELSQVQSRFGRAIGLGIFSLIWNGFTWTVLYFVVIAEWDKSDGSVWIPLIFLSIFALIGLFILFGFIHQLLALKNPRLKLTVNKGVYQPGETINLTWECIGNAFRVRSFTLTIEGRESATYTRGTDTVTDKHVFIRIPVVTIEDHADMMSGRISVTLPKEIPTTYNGLHNKIEYFLLVKGDIPRWPDISDEYGLSIYYKGKTS